MFDTLTGLGYGVITFAIVLGIGVVILQKFAGAVASCWSNATLTYTYNTTDGVCYSGAPWNLSKNPTSGATYVDYLEGQMGTTGLAGWTPAIIAFAIGMLFLGAFFIRKGQKGRSY